MARHAVIRWRRHAGPSVVAGIVYGLLTLTPSIGPGDDTPANAVLSGVLFALFVLLVGVAGEAVADRWRARR